MPNITTVNTARDKPEPTGVETFFSNLAKVYNDSLDDDKIGKITEQFNQSQKNENDAWNYYTEIQKSGASPSKQVAALNSFNEMQKTTNENRKTLNAQNGPQKVSKFTERRQVKGADELSDIEKEIPVLQDSLTNLDTIEKTFEKELTGLTGYGKAAFNSKSAKLVENLSASSLDSIIKKFNPAGTLPTAKLNWIKDTFAVKAGDRVGTMKGKVEAQRILMKQALKRHQEKAKLLDQYQGDIPHDVRKEFDNETLLQNDVIADQAAFKIKLKDAEDSGVVEGMYDQQGAELDPIPVEEAKKLFAEGLITNEPK